MKKNKNLNKIYLAKSNRSDPTLVSKVRALLKELEIEIVEFTGGDYSDVPLLECDYLLVIPHNLEYEDDRLFIGRGLYNQIDSFYCNTDTEKIFILSVCVDNSIYIDEVQDMYTYNESDRNWTTRWGIVETNQASINLINYGIYPKKDSKYGLEADIYTSNKPMLACLL